MEYIYSSSKRPSILNYYVQVLSMENAHYWTYINTTEEESIICYTVPYTGLSM